MKLREIEYRKKYAEIHKEEHKRYQKNYILTHKEQYKNSHITYDINHRKEKLEYQKNYYLSHKKERSLYIKKWHDNKLKTYVGFRIRCYLGVRLRELLKGNLKLESTMNLVGCSINQLKSHLESLFQPGMAWSNYGKWHIDHIIPCCKFNFLDLEQQKQCFHYTNLQPLWAKENMSKGGR